MKVGILGGVFNPPHIAHLVAAQEAHAQLGLDVVVWIPAGDPPHREIEQDPGAAIRLEMCELAISADARFKLSSMELDRPGPSYTADTLAELAERHPGDELWLILGSDQAAALPRWHEPERVLGLAEVAAFERPGSPREAVTADVHWLEMPLLEVSSSLIRRRAASGRPIRYLVPDKVAHFIGAQSLYGSSVPAA